MSHLPVKDKYKGDTKSFVKYLSTIKEFTEANSKRISFSNPIPLILRQHDTELHIYDSFKDMIIQADENSFESKVDLQNRKIEIYWEKLDIPYQGTINVPFAYLKKSDDQKFSISEEVIFDLTSKFPSSIKDEILVEKRGLFEEKYNFRPNDFIEEKYQKWLIQSLAQDYVLGMQFNLFIVGNSNYVIVSSIDLFLDINAFSQNFIEVSLHKYLLHLKDDFNSNSEIASKGLWILNDTEDQRPFENEPKLILRKTDDLAVYTYYLGQLGIINKVDLSISTKSKNAYKEVIKLLSEKYSEASTFKLNSCCKNSLAIKNWIKNKVFINKRSSIKPKEILSRVKSQLLQEYPELEQEINKEIAN